MKTISRRAVLRGTAGSAIALPLLDAMRGTGRARAATPPRRLLIMAVGNGTVLEHFWPTAPGATAHPIDMPLKAHVYNTGFTAVDTTEHTMSPILQPLAAHKSRVTVLEGIDNCNGTGGHRMYAALLTGIEPRSGNDGSLSARGTSVDQLLAAQLGLETKFPSLQLGVRNGDQHNLFGSLSWYGNGKQAPSENNPYATFGRLYGAGGDDVQLAALVRAQRRSVLDFARNRIRTLEGRVGADDRAKLGNYFEAIRSVEAQLSFDPAPRAACVRPTVATGLDDRAAMVTPQIAHAQIDMAVAAFACDLTRVITLQVGHEGSGMTHPWIGVNGGHHYDLGHSSDTDLARIADIVKVGQWHASLVARMIDGLANVREEGGTLLDRTLVVWVNGMAKGNTHGNANQPTLLAGNFGGAFKMGRYIRFARPGPSRYPLPVGRSYGDLWFEVLRAAGVEATSFGDPRWFHGGMPELRAG
jgi:hypothetical protein